MAEGLGNVIPLRKESPLRVVDTTPGPISEWSSEALMLAHCDGSEAAYAELVKRHQRGVLNYTYRMVQNRHVAEELTQEVFIALVKNVGRYEPRAKFTTYLYTIASNIPTIDTNSQHSGCCYITQKCNFWIVQRCTRHGP